MPRLIIVAGPNGSGKSTLTARLAQTGLDFGEYLNADDIALSLKGDAEQVSAEAQAEVRRRRLAALAAKQDHSFETVMSHTSHIEYLNLARQAGFEVILYFVATDDPQKNLRRVANRVLHGGHDVPAKRIIARYHRCLANLPAAIAAADSGLIFDNSSAKHAFRPLAQISGGEVEALPSRFVAPRWWQGVLAAL